MSGTARDTRPWRKPVVLPILESEAQEQARCAWRTLRPGALEPERIEVVTRKAKSAVCRLQGSKRSGFPLIAKRARERTARIERQLYCEILPSSPIRVPDWHGAVDAGESGAEETFCWMFVEDAGSTRMSRRDLVHRRLAADWLAGLHTTPLPGDVVSSLPDRGPGDVLGRLQSGRGWIERSLESPTPPTDRGAVDRMLAQLDVLESRWAELESRCAELPKTLVHGDFGRKNASVRRDAGRIELVVYDFEHAGLGFPGQDLCLVDLPRYAAGVREHWPGVDVQRMYETGRFLRLVSSIRWLSKSLGLPGSESADDMLGWYGAELADLIAAAGWTRS